MSAKCVPNCFEGTWSRNKFAAKKPRGRGRWEAGKIIDPRYGDGRAEGTGQPKTFSTKKTDGTRAVEAPSTGTVGEGGGRVQTQWATLGTEEEWERPVESEWVRAW